MAYGDPLDPATPDDAAIAGQGDDRIRELKRAIRQRLLSFFVNVDADPLVPVHGSIPVDIFSDASVDGKFLMVATIPVDRLIGGGVTADPGPNSVNTAAIQDKAVTNLKLGDNSVDARVLAPSSVTGTELAADAINTTQVIDGAINRPKLTAAMRGVLARVTLGSYAVPAGNLLASPSYKKIVNIPIVVNGVVSPDAMAIVTHATLNSDILIHTVIVGANIVVTVRDYENQGTKDLSGTTFRWMVVQPYEGAVPE